MDSTETIRTRRPVVTLIGVLFCVLLIVIAVVVGIRSHTTRTSLQRNQTGATSSDPVKRNTGPNGDINPSPNGTNPNGNNGILSQ